MKKVNGYINQEEIKSYLKDIRKIDVMTSERESELRKIMLSPDVTPEQRDQVKKEMITGNLRLVLTTCKGYVGNGLEFEDLVADGNVGLSKAFDFFDWNKDIRFSTYCSWWIRASIMEGLNNHGRTIRIPVNVIQEVNKNKKKDPSEIDIESDDLERSLPQVFSMDLDPYEDEGSYHDVIQGGEIDIDSLFGVDEDMKKELYSCLDQLDEREKKIIEDYYGFSGYCRTLQDIGNDYGLTKERVRQIKETAIRKIRTISLPLFNHRN
jgi:RNA polymerase primary sigma factor